jgi:hypothetical protein
MWQHVEVANRVGKQTTEKVGLISQKARRDAQDIVFKFMQLNKDSFNSVMLRGG